MSSPAERGSDTVAIMNKGELVIQAPIDDFLSDKASVTYTITLKGNLPAVYGLVSGLPFVRSVDRVELKSTGDAFESWAVTVSDAQAAEQHLLRAILSVDEAVVTKFDRKHLDLEEVFVSIVQGGGLE